MPNRRSNPADFGGLESYLEQAAWSRLNQARGVFVTHMDPHNREAVEAAWETALLTMAEKIRLQRVRKNTEALAHFVREAFAAASKSRATTKTDVEKTA